MMGDARRLDVPGHRGRDVKQDRLASRVADALRPVIEEQHM